MDERRYSSAKSARKGAMSSLYAALGVLATAALTAGVRKAGIEVSVDVRASLVALGSIAGSFACAHLRDWLKHR
jgi:hypothetical protein